LQRDPAGRDELPGAKVAMGPIGSR
jgi:hypothetical protein